MLEEKVLKWLKSTGFPLEMAAANAFRAEGFQIRQSSTYTDPETEKSREMDILAVDQDWIGAIQISYVLECKSSSKPWIVLTSEDAWAAFNRLSMFAVMSKQALNCLAERITDSAIQAHIERPSFGGYGLRHALSDGGDTAYTAACSVIKASMSVAFKDQKSEVSSAAFVFPVIVVDTPIFECSLRDDGELELREVRESDFLFGMGAPRPIATCIKIVTKDELPVFAQRARRTANQLRIDLKMEEQGILASLR